MMKLLWLCFLGVAFAADAEMLDEVLMTDEDGLFPMPEGITLSLGDSEEMTEDVALEFAKYDTDSSRFERVMSTKSADLEIGIGAGSGFLAAEGAFDFGCSCRNPYRSKYNACWWSFRGWSGYYPTATWTCPGYNMMWRFPCPLLHFCTSMDPPCWDEHMHTRKPPMVGWCLNNGYWATQPCPPGHDCPHLLTHMPNDGRKRECGMSGVGCGGKKTRFECIKCLANQARVLSARAMGRIGDLEVDYKGLYGTTRGSAEAKSITSRMEYRMHNWRMIVDKLKKTLTLAGDANDIAIAMSDSTQNAHAAAFLALGKCMIATGGGTRYWAINQGYGYYGRYSYSKRYWGSGDYWTKDKYTNDSDAPFGDCVFECMAWLRAFKDAAGLSLGDKGRPGDLFSAALSIPTVQYVMCESGLSRYEKWVENYSTVDIIIGGSS